MEEFVFVLSGLIGLFVTALGILYGKYRFNHKFVLKKPRYLIWYSLAYGILATILTAIIIQGDLKINDYEPKETPFLVAIFVGVSIKSLSASTLFNFPLGDKKIPIGPKIIFGYIDDFLLKKLNDTIDKQLVVEIKRVSKKLKSGGRTLREQNRLINEVTPTNFTAIERTGYMTDIEKLKDSFDKCRYFADKFGIDRLQMLEDNIDNE